MVEKQAGLYFEKIEASLVSKDAREAFVLHPCCFKLIAAEKENAV